MSPARPAPLNGVIACAIYVKIRSGFRGGQTNRRTRRTAVGKDEAEITRCYAMLVEAASSPATTGDEKKPMTTATTVARNYIVQGRA